MKRFFLALFLISTFILPLLAQDKRVLIINSYHRGFQWSDDIITGIEDVFYAEDSINTNIMYMDSKRLNSHDYYDKLKDLYKVKLKDTKYDLVVAIDRSAYDFVLDHYGELFTNEPILFVGLERFSLDDIKAKGLEDRVYGILERRAIDENLLLIEELLPALKKLYIVNDGSASGDDTMSFLEKAIKEHEDKFEIELIRSSTLDELKTKFSQPNADEAVFFIRFYNDKYGNLYKNSQIASMIDSSKLPVFITDTLFIDKGAAGGKLVLINEIGQLTAQLSLDILDKKVKPLHFVTFDDYAYIFDFEKIKDFSISLGLGSHGYEVINKPITFFQKHEQIINFVFVISPLLLGLILALLYNIFKRIKSEKKLIGAIVQKNKHQQFIIQQSKLAEIGELFSSIAHQWKNPLVEISTITQEHAFAYSNSKDDENNKYVQDIMVQVKYMTDTINDFQKFIIPSSGKLVFNIEESIKSTINIIEHTIKYNYIDIEIDKSRAKNLMVYGYKNEFMQTLLNIVNNAKDQIVEMRKRRTIKRGLIKFTIYNENKNVILEINDNGGGIKEWMVDRIFEAYFTTKEGGHGIGLYMTKLIIEDKMEGKIEVYNKDEGLCFKITLGNVQ